MEFFASLLHSVTLAAVVTLKSTCHSSDVTAVISTQRCLLQTLRSSTFPAPAPLGSAPPEAQPALELWGQTQAAAAQQLQGHVCSVCVCVWLEGFPPGNSGTNDTSSPLQESALKRKKGGEGKKNDTGRRADGFSCKV